MPPQRVRRLEIYDHVLQAGCQLHAALEDAHLSCREDIPTFDAVLTITPLLSRKPFRGRFPDTSEDRNAWRWIAKDVSAGDA